ncbi:MAG: 6-phosphogluconolactonase [Anaerolineales bacterium]|nr:6-phosphogluconolactonase [Anaerolineales bacterium]
MKSKPSVQTFINIDELSDSAKRSFIEIANEAIKARGRFLTVLSGGFTPIKLYEKLAQEKPALSNVEGLDWTCVHFFWGDERCVSVDDSGNNYGMAKKILFDQIAIPDSNIHRILSELEPAEAAKDYADTLKGFSEPPLEWPRFDLVLLGMGEDGHTAALFPGSPVDVHTPTLAVTAIYQDRPANRVTLTPIVFNQAREIWFLVTGNGKATMLHKVLKGEHKPDVYPAQRIQPVNGNLVWMIDEAAGRLL